MMRELVLAALLVAPLAANGLGEELAIVEDPLPVQVPRAVLGSWHTRSLPAENAGQVTAGARRVVVEGAHGPGRIDLLVRSSGGWRLSGSRGWDGFLPPVPRDETRIGVCARFAAEPDVFWWAETGPSATEPLVLEARKRIVVTKLPDAGPEIRLWIAGESEPRRGAVHESTFSFDLVPLVPAVACAREGALARCGLVAETATAPSQSDVRAFRLVHANGAPEVHAFLPGVSEIRPRDARVHVLRAGEWLLLGLAGEEVWTEAVLDLELPGSCPLRLRGAELPPVPAFQIVRPPDSCGLAVRPLLEPRREPLVEPEALLVFRDSEDQGGSAIALAVAQPDEWGVFRAPGLASGKYRLKLHSALVSSGLVTAELEVGSVESVSFAPGRLVRGRVVTPDLLPVGGQAVQVVRLARPEAAKAEVEGEARAQDGADALDALRVTTTGEDGGFAAGVPGSGSYELSVRTPRRRAVVRFVVSPAGDEIELGDVVLRGGSVLRGSVSGCATPAEILVLPLPNLAGPPTPRDVDIVRTAVGPDGRFEATNLPGGTVIVGATCAGVRKQLEPHLISLAEEGVEVRDFVVVEPIPAP